jgi:predicted phosphodiesterase
LKSIGNLNPGHSKPRLILNGDVLELALAHDNEAIMAFERFMEIMFPEHDEPLVANEIIFVPGNHDHHLWETARETQYAEFLKKYAPASLLEAPWHTTKMLDADPVNAFLLSTVVHRYEWMKEVSIQTVYPNLAFLSEDGEKGVIFTHGHFTESIYTAMSTFRKFLFPDSQMPVQVWDIEEENFAWIDFFWSTMGRSGAVGDDVERIYMMLLVPELRDKLAHQLGHAMAKAWIPQLPGGGLLMASFASALLGHVSGLEKSRDDEPISIDALAGLKAYVEGPLRNQFAADRKIVPSQATIVFGHTHKPFVHAMNFAGFPEQTAVFNTGGWVVDTPAVAWTHGAAIVLVDETWNVAALRIYNEGDYSVKVEAAETQSGTNQLFTQLKECVAQHPEPWAALSTAIAATVDSYHKDFSKRLRAIRPEASIQTSLLVPV